MRTSCRLQLRLRQCRRSLLCQPRQLLMVRLLSRLLLGQFPFRRLLVDLVLVNLFLVNLFLVNLILVNLTLVCRRLVCHRRFRHPTRNRRRTGSAAGRKR